MRVHNIQVSQQPTQTLVSADFVFSGPFGSRWKNRNFYLKRLAQLVLHPHRFLRVGFEITYPVWFALPPALSLPSHFSDAFFVIASVMATALNEPLDFDGAVSSELLKKRSEIERYYRFEHQKRKLVFQARKNNKKRSFFTGKAQFFTLGVDSFYTLAKERKEDFSRPYHLIYVDGFDVPLERKAFLGTLHKGIELVAEKTGSTPLFVQTNVRDIAEKALNWGQFHGAALAAVGLLFPFETIFINGESFDWPDWGLRYGIDRLFSTDTKKFELVGHNLDRDVKIELLKTSPFFALFLEHVRVCWRNVDSRTILYNCSECQKCLKTMLILSLAGVKELPTFRPLRLRKLKDIELVGHVRHEWTALYDQLQRQTTADPKLVRTLEHVLHKPLKM